MLYIRIKNIFLSIDIFIIIIMKRELIFGYIDLYNNTNNLQKETILIITIPEICSISAF